MAGIRACIYKIHREMHECIEYYKAINQLPHVNALNEILERIIEDNIDEVANVSQGEVDLINDADWIRTTVRPIKDNLLNKLI